MSKQSQYNQNLVNKRKAQGLCIRCNNTALPEHYFCQLHLENAIKQREKAKKKKANCNHYYQLGFDYCPLCGVSMKKIKKDQNLMNEIHEQKPLKQAEEAKIPPQNLMNLNHDNLMNKDHYETKPISSDVTQFLASKVIAPKPISTPVAPAMPKIVRGNSNPVSFSPEVDDSVNLDVDF